MDANITGMPELPRVPPPVDGVQVNFCRTAACRNFGVPPTFPEPGEQPASDGYRVTGSTKAVARPGKGRPPPRSLRCTICGASSVLRSNIAVVEEAERLAAPMALPPEPTCSKPTCANHGLGAYSRPDLYAPYGKTKAGSRRWQCKTCGTTLSNGNGRRTQRRSSENLLVFRALVLSKAPIRGIARITGLGHKAVYDKLAFIHEQCLAFAADRERELPKMDLSRLWLSTDRQDYVLNWTDRGDKRNTQLTAVGTADNVTGYVFGQHLNYDPEAVPASMEAAAAAAGDFDGRDAPFRRHARLWLPQEYPQAVYDDPGPAVPRPLGQGVAARVAERLEEVEAVEDPEALDRMSPSRRLPKTGMQTHVEYTVMAHFRLLRRLLGHAGKTRFFIDQDDTLWAGCLASWADVVKAGLADVFFVQIDKELTVDQRKRLVAEGERTAETFRQATGNLSWSNVQIRRAIICEQLWNMDPSLPWRRRWVRHPHHTLYEPDKAVCYASDRGDMDVEHLAALMDRASLHGIDRFFMQLRRMLSLLERPIATPSNVRRVWRGYSPYNPLIVQRIIDIYRVFYNFVKLGEPREWLDGKPIRETPAMRLGLARGPVRMEDILYFGR